MSLVKEWYKAKNALAEARAMEIYLRNELLGLVNTTQDVPLHGSKTVFINSNKIRITNRLNYTLDEEEFAILAHSLPQEELACVKYKPVLNIKEFNLLGDDATLKTLVTVKPGQGSVTLL